MEQRFNYCCTNDAETVRKLFEAGVEFALVDNVRSMVEVAAEQGIAPLKPIFRNDD